MKRGLKIILPILILLTGLGAALLLIFLRKEVESQSVPFRPREVAIALAHPTNHQFQIETQGTVRPRTEIQLVPEVSGRVIEVAASMAEGGFFEKGDWLLKMDPRDFELAVTNAQSTLAEAQYQLSFERAEAAVARREWETLGDGAEPNPLLLRKPQLARAQANLASARAALEQARRDLQRCVIRAPFAGRVGRKMADIGQYITKGSPVARLFAVDYAEVRLPLTADDLAYVDLPLDYRGEERAGQGPRVFLSANVAGQEHVWTGHIDRTEGEIDTRTRMLFAVARVKNPYGRAETEDRPPLVVGLFVQARILGRTVSDVFVLPRTALRDKDIVLVVNDTNRIVFRKVKIMRADRESIIVRDGLRVGDRVCTQPPDVVTENMKVTVADPRPDGSMPKKAAEGAGDE